MNARANFYWSVRRELWEHRAAYIAPLAVAALALLGFLYHVPKVLATMRGLSTLPAAKQLVTVVTPYSLAASVIILTSFLVGVFYCLDALNAERRDRSILFWKSMPVSDLTTVLAKVFIPVAVLPFVAYVVAFTTQLIMLMVSSVALLATGVGPGTQWDTLPFFSMSVVMLYGLAVHVLWYAPIYGWLLLVSAWAKRTPFLWAVLPFLAIMFVEMLALGTSAFAALLRYRVLGAMSEAFTIDAMRGPITKLSQLDPAKFFASPGLWMGLAFAVACLFAVVRLRRYRDPN
jgi:ABC-2 type transport system permease protein